MKYLYTIILIAAVINIFCGNDDYDRGVKDAELYLKDKSDIKQYSLLSTLTSLFFPGCGCVGVSIYAYFDEPQLPELREIHNIYYMSGFKKTFIPAKKNERMSYSLTAGGVGTVISVATYAVIVIILKNL